MRRYLLLCSALILAMLILPALSAHAQTATPTATNTPTSTATATATSTITATPALVVTGVTSNNQGYEIKRSITAGDIIQILIMLIGVGLFCFIILLETKQG